MKEPVKLSIIVSVYNTEAYLKRCLDSILGQTYGNMEVILVDDGSTDGSDAVCDRLARTDTRVRVIHKSNGGTVSARRCGLTHARGQLVGFIDSDDWIEADMYENLIEMYDREEGPDLVSSGIIYEYPETGEKKVVWDGADDGKYNREAVEQKIAPVLIYDPMKMQDTLLTSVCTKLIRKTIAEKAMEYMDPLLTMGEDGAYTYFLVGCCSSLAITHKAYYHYEQHVNSQNYHFGAETFQKLTNLKTVMTEGISRLGWGSDRRIQEQIHYYVWGYLSQLIESRFQFGIGRFMYLFPFARCHENAVILLYGAGAVGRSYRKCLKQSGFAKKIVWADQNYIRLQADGWNVVSVDEALLEPYDYIVIAIEDEAAAQAAAERFIARGIEKKKLIWERPVRLSLFS